MAKINVPGRLKSVAKSSTASENEIVAGAIDIYDDNIKDNQENINRNVKSKLDTISPNAQPNQNAFSNVKVGSTTISAGTTTDTVTFAGASNVTVSANTSNKTVTITGPNLANYVQGPASATDGAIAVFNGTGGKTIKTSAKTIKTTLADADTDNSSTIPTAAAIVSYVTSKIGGLAGALVYKGTIGTGGTVTTLPANHTVGDVYVVKTAGTYAGKACEVGDYVICNTTGTSANNNHWDVLNGENQVDNKNATLNFGATSTIATVDGTDIKVTMPARPEERSIAVNGTTTTSDLNFVNGDGVTLALGNADAMDVRAITVSADSSWVSTEIDESLNTKNIISDLVLAGGGDGVSDLNISDHSVQNYVFGEAITVTLAAGEKIIAAFPSEMKKVYMSGMIVVGTTSSGTTSFAGKDLYTFVSTDTFAAGTYSIQIL